MKKLKLLFGVAALFCVIGSINAYTTDDLINNGWTKVTSPISGVADNYYILVDCNSSAYVMANQADHFRPCYKTIDDPVANPSFVWILEGSNNEFALKSYSTGAYFKQVSGWNTSVGYSRDSRQNVTGVFELNEGKYTLKCKESNNFIGHWNDNGAAVANDGENIAANKAAKDAPGFYLYSIPRATFDADLASSRFGSVSAASKTSPANVTSYIQNADWSNDWGGWELTFTSVGNMQWSKKTLESWQASNVIFKQELKGVPNGTYKLTADIISGPGAAKAAYVFATGDAKVSSDVVSVEASANNYDTMSSEVAGNTLTADNIKVTGNAITVGIDQSAGWIVADNFKLYYYGPNLASSKPLPDDGVMEPNTWYYIDITIAGTYNLTCTTLTDIVYSTDGSTLVEDGTSVNTSFDSNTPDLEVGRYYVKSSSSQKLTVAAASYSYEIVSVTSSIAEGCYLQSLTAASFVFEAASNDPNATFELLNNTSVASLKKTGSEVATGTLSLDGTTLTATFSGVTLDMASSYTIELPADVVGYADEAQNAAVSINFNTPAIADGLYYFYNTYTKNYLSRGGNWGTQAIMDDYGVPAYLEFDVNGKTRIKFFDNYKFLSDGGWLYADNATGGQFLVEAVSGGYKFKDATNTSNYVAVNDNKAVGDAVEGNNLDGTSNVWLLETPAQYKTNDNATSLANAQATTVATNAGLTGITSLEALESELLSKYMETSIEITGAKGEQYNANAGSNPLTEKEYVKETVSNLKPGIYRLTVDAFQRASSNDRVAAAEGANSLVYVYAGAAKTQIKSVMAYGSDEAYNSDFAYDGKHYPNDENSAYTALETGNYKNVVYVYVADEGGGKGSLTFGINNPQNTNAGGWPNALWAAYNNFTLTHYEKKVVNISENDDYTPVTTNADVTLTRTIKQGINTLVLPFSMTQEEVESTFGNGSIVYVASSYDATKGNVSFEISNGIEANKPCLLEATAASNGDYILADRSIEAGEPEFGTSTISMIGTYAANITVPENSYIISSGKFYLVDSEVTLKGTRAYFLVEGGSSARTLTMSFDGETTGIATLENGELKFETGDIYDLSGRKVKNPTKGIYLINGKKIIK